MKIYDELSAWLLRWLTLEDPPRKFPLCDFERLCYEIRPCDVLLVEGRNRVSEVIKMITQSNWSHSMLYIGRLHDIENPALRERVQHFFHGDPHTQLVIESVIGHGTMVTPLNTYARDHIRICRPDGISRQDAHQVIAYSIERLGVEYDIRHIFDLARFLLPWSILPRRWRSTLFRHTAGPTTRTVCSSMLAEAFNAVHFPILPVIQDHIDTGIQLLKRNPRLFTPSDFDYSPYFAIIKYPFLEVTGKSMYRDLPWSKEGNFSNDDEEKFAASRRSEP